HGDGGGAQIPGEVEVCAGAEVVGGDGELFHQAVGDACAFGLGLGVGEDDFECEVGAEVFDAVEVDAGLGGEVEPAFFFDGAEGAQGGGEEGFGFSWVGDGGDEVRGTLGVRG